MAGRARSRHGHIHIHSMGGQAEIGLSTRIAGQLIEERVQKARMTKSAKRAEKDELLRPRRYVFKEEESRGAD